MVSYGISINLVEVTWKSKIKQQFPNPNDYSAFMGDFSSSTGALPCCLCQGWPRVAPLEASDFPVYKATTEHASC